MISPHNEADSEVVGAASAVGADPASGAAYVNRISRPGAALAVVAVIVLVAALYLARAFFVPLLIGILASYMLRPVVDWLKALHVPRPVAAALVLLVLVGSLSWIAFSLSDQATTMIDKLPEAAIKLR